MSLTTEKYIQPKPEPTTKQKAALFEFRRRMRGSPDRFTPKQLAAEKEISQRWGISEAVGELGPEPPAGRGVPAERLYSPKTEYKPNLFGGTVGTPISGSLEEFQKAAETALTKSKTGRTLTQFGLGVASGLTGGATELGLKLRATPLEAKEFESSGFVEKASRGAGQLVGFMGGAPLKLSTALVSKILPKVAKETVKRKIIRESATLGLAELIGNNEQLADVIKQPSYQAGVTALGNRLTSAAAGALTGAQFGLVREKLSKFTSRALANVILSNALHETMSGTERPTEDVIYDSLLAILFSRKGTGPVKSKEELRPGEVRELKPDEIEIIPPETEAELRGFAKVVAPEVKSYLPPITKTTTAAVNQPRGDYVGEIPEVRVPRSGYPGDRPSPPVEQAPVATERHTAGTSVPDVKTPEQIVQERKQRIVDEHLALKERKLEFAKQQQVEKERIIAEKTAEREEKRREALKSKLGEKFGEEKVTVAKEKKKETPKPKIEKTPITAETKPITGTEPLGQPATGVTAITEEGKEPVAARPTEEQIPLPTELATDKYLPTYYQLSDLADKGNQDAIKLAEWLELSWKQEPRNFPSESVLDDWLQKASTVIKSVEAPRMPSGEFNPKIDIETVKSHAESGIKEAQDVLLIREAKPQVASEVIPRKVLSSEVRDELTKNIADLNQKIEKERRLNGETDRYRRLIDERDRVQSALGGVSAAEIPKSVEKIPIESGITVGEEKFSNKVPRLDEALELVDKAESSQGGRLYPEKGEKYNPDEHRFKNKQKAKQYVRDEVIGFFEGLPDKVPIYRAIRADEVRLDPYGIGENWSFDLDAAKEFGVHAGANKIIKGYTDKSNIDFGQSVQNFHLFSQLGGESEFEVIVPANAKIERIVVEDRKTATELPDYYAE